MCLEGRHLPTQPDPDVDMIINPVDATWLRSPKYRDLFGKAIISGPTGGFDSPYAFSAAQFDVIGCGKDTLPNRLYEYQTWMVHMDRNLTPNLAGDFDNIYWINDTEIFKHEIKAPNHEFDASLLTFDPYDFDITTLGYHPPTLNSVPVFY
jgi:hypothetical protein